MSEPNFTVILFKNNKKRKILKSFVRERVALEYYNKKLKESSEIWFSKEYENGLKCNYKIALTTKTCDVEQLYYTDEIGRNISINPKISDNLYIKKIDMLLLVYEFSNPKLQLSRTWVSKCSQKICKKSQYLTQKTQQLKKSS